MAELLSIMKSDCGCRQAVTATTVSVKLRKISQNLWRAGTDLVQTFAHSYTRQIMWEVQKKSVHVCLHKGIFVIVYVCVSMLGPQKEREAVVMCARMKITLFCISKHNISYNFNQINVDSEVLTGTKLLRRPTDLRTSVAKPTEPSNSDAA